MATKEVLCPVTNQLCETPGYCGANRDTVNNGVEANSYYGQALAAITSEVSDVLTTNYCAEERVRQLTRMSGDVAVGSLARYEALQVRDGVRLGQDLFRRPTDSV